MMWSENKDHIYIYYNGKLIYKKRRPECHGFIFDLFGLPWSACDFKEENERYRQN